MVKSKENLAELLTQLLLPASANKSLAKKYAGKLEYKYDFPTYFSKDVISLKKDLAEESDFTVFCVADIVSPDLVRDFFTEEEIDIFSSLKFKKEKIKFPLKLKMIEVSDGQWIGATSVKELMKFRDAQLINYNENAQRTLTRKVQNGVEYYQISLNKNAVSSIKESLESELYIPNTITLNMPFDTDYVYNGEELIIHSISAFDILDGYHRYIAMSNESNIEPDFDYPMELRIVSFPDAKAKQFIYQEDQKTQMSKVESNSYNQSDPGNKVVNMLKDDIYLSGVIGKYNSKVDSVTLANAISSVYFTSKKDTTNSYTLEVAQILSLKMRGIMKLFDDKLNNSAISIMIFLTNATDLEGDELIAEIKNFNDVIMSDRKLKDLFCSRNVNKTLMTRLNRIWNGGDYHV